jgi:dTDP-4-dehydrorhamnose reductase
MKVLILGDGLLGSELIKITGWDFLSRKSHSFNIDNFKSYINSDYDIIINCIANTNTYSEDRESHWNVNVKFVDKLIDYCNDKNIKLVHISTDYVYSGSESNASEESVPVHCNTWYGYTKLVSDAIVQLRSKNYLLIRCTFKPTPFPYKNAWIDQVGNFDYVDVIANLIIKSITKGLCGLYNIGTETKTMFELASKTINVGKSFVPNNIPKNTSIDISKLLTDLNE